jgi:hypothetical protein
MFRVYAASAALGAGTGFRACFHDGDAVSPHAVV